MSDTLVLNADCSPISVFPISTFHWMEAIKNMFLERVEILSEYDDWEVHSPSITYKVPAIVMLRDYVRTTKVIRFTKDNIKLRDEYACQYCGAEYFEYPEYLTLDHVLAKMHGGRTTWTNIVAACMSCNLEKSHYMKMKPIKEPKKPTYYELLDKRMQYPLYIPHIDWNEYLQWNPDLIKIIRK